MHKNSIFTLILLLAATSCAAQTVAPSNEFHRFGHIIFHDDFSQDTIGHFPSKWEWSCWNLFPGFKPNVLQDYKDSSKIKSYFQVLSADDGERYLSSESFNAGLEAKLNSAICPDDSFTMEFDFRLGNDRSWVWCMLNDKKEKMFIGYEIYSSGYLDLAVAYWGEPFFLDAPHEDPDGHDKYKVRGKYPVKFDSRKWHHLAVLHSNKTTTFFIDHYKIVALPGYSFKTCDFTFAPEGETGMEAAGFKNFLITAGNCYSFSGLLAGNKLVTHAIHFGNNQFIIKPESAGFITELAAWLLQNPSVKLEIDGHTDNEGDAAANGKLSQNRADEVKKQLVLQGIAANRLITKGYGDTKPVRSNTTPEGKATNRRVEFIKL